MTAPTSREELLAEALEDCLHEHGGFTIKGECERKARAALAFTDPAQDAANPEYEFPYQQTFEAIAAATEIYPSKEQALGLSISVKKFQEAFNSHRDRRPLSSVASTERGTLSSERDNG